MRVLIDMTLQGKLIAAAAALAIAGAAIAVFVRDTAAPEVRFATLGGEWLALSDQGDADAHRDAPQVRAARLRDARSTPTASSRGASATGA